ncbi:MAG: 3'-5' exonuclease domain-containing protein 2 [Puniceicoccales bacterium]|jgi:ribonuclease D|nr:3'-5' exonuclease domain-containing protein 2 [Puniceicoccales bacterium]
MIPPERSHAPKLRRSADKQFVESLPLLGYGGKIILLRDRVEAEKAVEKLLREEVLGFDTETRPAFHRGQHYDTAIVQLSTADLAYIFQLKYCGGVDVLLPIFEAKSPLKVCIGVADDVKRLMEIRKFSQSGFVELTDVTKPLGIVDGSLRKLSAIVLGIRISKREQTSNWAKEVLTDSQLRYAATDAWVSLRIYEEALRLGAEGIQAE